jgi:hypothetical protein
VRPGRCALSRAVGVGAGARVGVGPGAALVFGCVPDEVLPGAQAAQCSIGGMTSCIAGSADAAIKAVERGLIEDIDDQQG